MRYRCQVKQFFPLFRDFGLIKRKSLAQPEIPKHQSPELHNPQQTPLHFGLLGADGADSVVFSVHPT
ncbi:MAG: hypothetical protein WCL39_13055 [Armatimonadota bacterium]